MSCAQSFIMHDTPSSNCSYEGIVASTIPLLCPFLSPSTVSSQPQLRCSRLQVKQPYDWNYTITPQPGFKGRSVAYARGKVLGGSSTTSKSFHFCHHHTSHIF